MTDAAAWALVHFLWQGAALALVAWILMRLAAGPSVRYVIGVSTMTAMVVVLGLTFASLIPAAVEVEPIPAPAVNSLSIQATETQVPPPTLSPVPAATPFVLPTAWVLTLWASGVCLLSLRILGGWVLARRVAREAMSPLAADLQPLAAGVRARLGIRRVVRVVESARVAVPVMIGWIRPVVLVPPAAIAGLSPTQLEAILAHEFAHIRRHDYLVNLLQTAVETVLFFHPAVWWLSREIRRERELCCDDLAIGACDRLTYATALSALAHLQPPTLALAATDGSLRDRVRRIVSSSPSSESAKGGWMAMLPLVLVISLAAPSVFTQAPAPASSSVDAAAEVTQAATTPPGPTQVAAVPKPTEPAIVTRPAAQAAPVQAPVRAADPVMEQLLDEQLAIARRKLALDKARLENDTLFDLRRLELDVRNSEVNLDDIRKKVATGLVTENNLRNLEYNHQIQLTRLASAKRTLDLGLEEIAIREQELALQRRMQTIGVLPEAMIITADTITLAGNASVAMGQGKTLTASDVIRAGDAVSIRIAGEELLPREFTVEASGSIRYPFFGPIRVEGSTTAQVQAAIVKLLSDRRLVENPQVTVSATRR